MLHPQEIILYDPKQDNQTIESFDIEADIIAKADFEGRDFLKDKHLEAYWVQYNRQREVMKIVNDEPEPNI